MKLAWASPLVVQSAIGRAGAAAIDELIQRGHHVDAIRLEHAYAPSDRLHACAARVRGWREMDAAALAEYDLVIVNIGDNFLFHGGAFALLRDAQCLGVFHDFYLYNLFNGWLADRRGDGDLREQQIVATYGPGASVYARGAREGALDAAEIAARIPMTEWMARRCAGALAHAAFYRARLEQACPGPVAAKHLPWPARTRLTPPAREGENLTVLTLGVVNPNKCIDLVIEAIAASPALAARTAYHVIG